MIPSKSTKQDEEDKIRDALFILKAGEPLCYIINGFEKLRTIEWSLQSIDLNPKSKM